MDEIYEKFLSYRKVSGIGGTYDPIVKNFLRYCEKNNKDYLTFTHDDYITIMLNFREKNYSIEHMNKFLKALRFFYRFLETTQGIRPPVVDKLKQHKLLVPPKKEITYITREELDEVVEMAMSFTVRVPPEKIRATLYFLFFTGLRKGEFIRLKRQDINLEECEFLVRIPNKTQTERYGFFPKKVGEYAKEYFNLEEEVHGAFNATPETLVHMMRSINDFLPKKHVSIHSFRHSFGMYLAESGVDIAKAQKLMGHARIEDTLIYYRITKDIAKKAYREQVKFR